MPAITLNWIDILAVCVLIFAAIEGWRLGFIHLLASFCAYGIAVAVSLRYHAAVGQSLVRTFHLSPLWSDVAGYIVLIALTLIIFTRLFIFIMQKVVEKIVFTTLDSILGLCISVVNATLLLFITFLIIIALPDAVSVKEGVDGSVIAHKLLGVAQKYGGSSILELEKTISENVRFITVDQNSGEIVHLTGVFQNWNMVDDPQGAQAIVNRINEERRRILVPPLVVDKNLTAVALAHSRDMFEHRYFAHQSLDGKTMKDRLKDAGVTVYLAAENLAFAPDTDTAHQGLMDSPQHRETILDPSYVRVGVGVVDSGGSGIMVTELFAR